MAEDWAIKTSGPVSGSEYSSKYHAGLASASATSANDAKTAAESARDQTLAAYDQFDDRYLGTKASDPTVDNDGDPLVAGSLYFNSVSGVMRLYTGSAWVAAYVSGTASGILNTPAGNIASTNVQDALNELDSEKVATSAIGVTVQAYDADTTKNDEANTFTANQVISVTDNTNAALRVTQLGTGNALVVEDSTNPDSSPFVIDANGNVGIGTSSPTFPLSIEGSNASEPNIGITLTNSQSGAALSAVATGTSFSAAGWIGVADGVILRSGSNTSGGLALTTGAAAPLILGTNNTERMRIDDSGNVLIQTTTPTSTSNVGASFQPTANSRAILYLGTSTTSGNTLAAFRNPNGQVGSISVSGSATTYNTSSDYRLKENIAPMTGALETVAQLKPVTYNWKVDGSDGQGFIAHELQEVVPECVFGEKDGVDAEGNPEYQGIDTSFLVATLTAAIQELKARIEVLEEVNNAV